MPYCRQCGAEIGASQFCPACGAGAASPESENPYAVGSQTQTSGVVSEDPNEAASEIPTFLGAYPTFWKKRFVFNKRSSRREFWYVWLWQTIILTPFCVIISATAGEPSGVLAILAILYLLYVVACFIPAISLFFRRVHDSGLPAGLLLLFLVPRIGVIASIIFGLTPPTQGPNKYGPQPRKRAKE
ncbi:MAG: DUF805 domain-containing protein [Thermoguttaceae bacterium]|nr:DUF805 domain-containing protein [Thermoguttaceae bacterium]